MLKYGSTLASDINGDTEVYLTLSQPIEDLLGTRKSNEYRDIEEIVNSGEADLLDFARYEIRGKSARKKNGNANAVENTTMPKTGHK